MECVTAKGWKIVIANNGMCESKAGSVSGQGRQGLLGLRRCMAGTLLELAEARGSPTLAGAVDWAEVSPACTTYFLHLVLQVIENHSKERPGVHSCSSASEPKTVSSLKRQIGSTPTAHKGNEDKTSVPSSLWQHSDAANLDLCSPIYKGMCWEAAT